MARAKAPEVTPQRSERSLLRARMGVITVRGHVASYARGLLGRHVDHACTAGARQQGPQQGGRGQEGRFSCHGFAILPAVW